MSTTWLQVVLTTLASNLAQTLPADDNIVSSTESLPTPQPWSDRPLCPLWGPMDGFYREGIEAGRYLGRWWLQDSFTQLSDLYGRCRSQVYSYNLVNNTLHRQTDFISVIGNQPQSESGNIRFEDMRDSNLLKYTAETGYSQVYRVLATDYDTFTIEYTCQDNAIVKRREQIWIYTRAKSPTRNVLKRAYKSLKILGLNGWKLNKADQSCEERDAAAERQGQVYTRRNYQVGRPESHLDMGTVQSRSSPLQEGRERERGPDIPITTGELTQRMIGSGLKLAQSVLAPWTLHPLMGFERNTGRLRKSSRRRTAQRERTRVRLRGWE